MCFKDSSLAKDYKERKESDWKESSWLGWELYVLNIIYNPFKRKVFIIYYPIPSKIQILLHTLVDIR